MAPLQPLDATASREIFVDISDCPTLEEEADFAEIIDLTGHVPLAISLMASISSSEGYSRTLYRWKREDIALLSAGHDKGSNLEKSILMSLTSPRISGTPAALKLLSVLSVLPDGLADTESAISIIPIPLLLQAKSALLRTSLAYVDCKGRLRALSPVRAYVQKMYPPEDSLLKCLESHWRDLLKLWDSHQHITNKDLVAQLTGDIGNLDSLILYRERTEGSLGSDTLHSIITLTTFSQCMLKSDSALLPLIPKYIDQLQDIRLGWKYLMLRLSCSGPHVTLSEAKIIIPRTMDDMVVMNDSVNQGEKVTC